MRAPLLLALSLLSACARSQNQVDAAEQGREREQQELQSRFDDARPVQYGVEQRTALTLKHALEDPMNRQAFLETLLMLPVGVFLVHCTSSGTG
jgi:hypothetical protein